MIAQWRSNSVALYLGEMTMTHKEAVAISKALTSKTRDSI